MAIFILRRLGVMILTALCLTFVVFFLTNLYPNLEKLAKTQTNFRASDDAVHTWLANRGYRSMMAEDQLAALRAGELTQDEEEELLGGFDPRLIRNYGEWLGIMPGYVIEGYDGVTRARCAQGASPVSAEEATEDNPETPTFCGILQGQWGYSQVFRNDVGSELAKRLGLTGYLMLWVMIVMVPGALIVGVLAGMREGSRMDRSLSTASILTTATPEYVSGVIFVAIFATPLLGLQVFKGVTAKDLGGITFENFFLPVITIALYGMGYIARMTRASMTEVMTAQYIRTARLKGVAFHNIVLRHALRNALIAPFTVIMLQFPWLLNGVVIVEFLFGYPGFGSALVQAAGNNDIDLLLGVSVVSVFVVLVTQLISDIGYVFLNPRIRIN